MLWVPQLVPTLRSGKVWQIWRFAMFLSISLPLSRNLTPSLSYQIVRERIAKVTDFLSFCLFGISIFPFCTIGISMYQKRFWPYIIIPYFLTPSFFPFGALQTDGQRNLNTPPCYLSSFFFPLSARGPSRRRNSTGLAELWGGWPIEQVFPPRKKSKNCASRSSIRVVLKRQFAAFYH